MGLVYIRQVHVIGTILQMEVVQSDGKTKLCTVLCQFLDWPFKTNKIITHNLPTMQCFYWLKHTLFLPSINVKKNYSLKMSFFIKYTIIKFRSFKKATKLTKSSIWFRIYLSQDHLSFFWLCSAPLYASEIEIFTSFT